MTENSIRRLCLVFWQLWPTLIFWGGAIVALIVIERLIAPPLQWDRLILGAAQRMRRFWLDGFFTCITWTGSLYLLMPATAAIGTYLARAGRSEDALLLALGLAGASLLAHISKPLFARVRPDLFPSLVQLPTDASYPSAHSAQIFAFALSLYLALRLGGDPSSTLLLSILFFWAAAVGFSRVYLQVHYPSDVVSGALLALLWVWGLEHFLNVLGIRVR